MSFVFRGDFCYIFRDGGTIHESFLQVCWDFILRGILVLDVLSLVDWINWEVFDDDY